MDIRYFIPHGKENAVHQNYLSDLLGVSTMSVKRAIKRARAEDKNNKSPLRIASGREGYWYSDDRSEIRKCRKSMWVQSTECKETADLLSFDDDEPLETDVEGCD